MTITNDLVELSIEANRSDRGHLKFDFPELKIGTADYTSAQTGCTVFSFEQRAMMVSDCRGGAIGAIGTHYPEVDAICFAGGSAYGQEAILGVIGSMDKPASPAGEARKHFYQQLFGRSHQQHLDYREAVMTVSLDDLHRVSESYLSADAHIAVVTHQDNAEAFASSDYQATIVKI